jgi:hypothetical protein
MSSYVSRIVHIVLQATITGTYSSEYVKARDLLLQALTENTPTDVCVEALVEAWSSIPHEKTVCHDIRVLMQMFDLFITVLDLVIVEGSREDLTGSSTSLFDLFLKLFDIRNETALKPKVYLV